MYVSNCGQLCGIVIDTNYFCPAVFLVYPQHHLSYFIPYRTTVGMIMVIHSCHGNSNVRSGFMCQCNVLVLFMSIMHTAYSPQTRASNIYSPACS